MLCHAWSFLSLTELLIFAYLCYLCSLALRFTRLRDLGRSASQSGGLWGYLQSTADAKHQNQRNVKSSHRKRTFWQHQTSSDIRYIAISWNLGVPKASISPWKHNLCHHFGVLHFRGCPHSSHSNMAAQGLGNQPPGEVWPPPHGPAAKFVIHGANMTYTPYAPCMEYLPTLVQKMAQT